MAFEEPRVFDFGSIAQHTFTNTGTVPGEGPTGKDVNGAPENDKFDEPSAGTHGLS